MGHATLFFFKMRGGPHPDVKARHSLFCAGWWAEVDGGARRRDEEMKDDMRLKSVVVKNAGKFNLPCLDKCTDKDHCPCAKMKTYIDSLSDTSTLEIEWMYVPTVKSVIFWTKVMAPIVITLILIGLCFIKVGCCSVFSGGDDKIKVSLDRNGCQVERTVSSVIEFERATNDLTKIFVGLKRIGAAND